LTGGRENYSVSSSELASHGYIIFSIDHHDGSCRYTENAELKSWKYDADINIKDAANLQQRLMQRGEEVK
jgi:hypothetical protein